MVRVEARKTTRIMFDSIHLNQNEHTFQSNELDCVAYSKFLLSYRLTENGALVNTDTIRFIVQFREEGGGTWYDYTNGPFGALYEEESTTPCSLSTSGDCVGEKMRLCIYTNYAGSQDPTNDYWTVTAKVTLME